ncbi:MAG: hypothetical protein HWE10_00470 [Gammaproteobacteria bacterium]|nr:hypothetical protein [Gammaproteobacteria bacterium]
MTKFSLYILLCLFLIGCSSGDEESSDGDRSSISYPYEAPMLADIAGIWVSTSNIDGESVEEYSVFNSDGTYTNYYNTESSSGEKCYASVNGELLDLGSGEFKTTTYYSEQDDNYSFASTQESLTKITLNSDTELIGNVISVNNEAIMVSGGTESVYTFSVEVVSNNELNTSYSVSGSLLGDYNLTREDENTDWLVTDATTGMTVSFDTILFTSEEFLDSVLEPHISSKFNGQEADITPLCQDDEEPGSSSDLISENGDVVIKDMDGSTYTANVVLGTAFTHEQIVGTYNLVIPFTADGEVNDNVIVVNFSSNGTGTIDFGLDEDGEPDINSIEWNVTEKGYLKFTETSTDGSEQWFFTIVRLVSDTGNALIDVNTPSGQSDSVDITLIGEFTKD